VDGHAIPTTSGTAAGEIERLCRDQELVVTEWAPIHLRTELQRPFYWPTTPYLTVGKFWDDVQKFPFLPRLKSREVLAGAVRAGTTSRDFFGTAYAFADGKYDGFEFGTGGVTVNDSLLLIEPRVAKEYAIALKKLVEVRPPETSDVVSIEPDTDAETTTVCGTGTKPAGVHPAKVRSYRGGGEIAAERHRGRPDRPARRRPERDGHGEGGGHRRVSRRGERQYAAEREPECAAP
jgi:uncharacterized protein